MSTYSRLVGFLDEYKEGVDYFIQSKEINFSEIEFTIYVNNDDLCVTLKLSLT